MQGRKQGGQAGARAPPARLASCKTCLLQDFYIFLLLLDKYEELYFLF